MDTGDFSCAKEMPPVFVDIANGGRAQTGMILAQGLRERLKQTGLLISVGLYMVDLRGIEPLTSALRKRPGRVKPPQSMHKLP
jgi:hypothetical protein